MKTIPRMRDRSNSQRADSKHPLDRDTFRLYVMLSQVYFSMERLIEKQLLRDQITFEQATTLLVAEYLGREATPGKIAQWLFRERNSTTGVLNRMAALGLVTKTKDLPKRNMIRVALTKKGQDAFDRSKDKWNEITELFKTLSPEERRQFRALLQKLREKAFEMYGVDVDSFFR